MRKQLRSSPNVKWIVDYAPMPSDIFWENLSIPRPCWYLNAVLINCALGIILFFLTTPAVSQFLSARAHYNEKYINKEKYALNIYIAKKLTLMAF